jgi:hypothetical protein
VHAIELILRLFGTKSFPIFTSRDVDLEKNKVQQNSKHALFHFKINIIVLARYIIGIYVVLEARQSHARKKKTKTIHESEKKSLLALQEGKKSSQVHAHTMRMPLNSF